MRPSGTFDVKYEQDLSIIRTPAQRAWAIVGLVLLLCFPLFAGSHWVTVITLIAITIVSVQGLNFLTGYCGQISLGQAAFMAVGAYASGILTTKLGFPFLVALPVSGIIAGVIGLVFGLPALKVKGFYLAMSTLAAQFIIEWVIKHLVITGGTGGMAVVPASIGAFIFESERASYYLVVIVTMIMLYFAKNLVRTKVGRAWIAVRDNDLAAEIMGVNLYHYKLLAFFICSFYAGIAGSLWAHYLTVISPDHFVLQDSIWYLGMIIVGGMGSVTGTVLGVVFLKLLDEFVIVFGPVLAGMIPSIGETISASLGLMFLGLVIILFLILEPRGLYHRWELFKTWYRLHPFSY
jgi:branched-chain amino acid transport system permease protein